MGAVLGNDEFAEECRGLEFEGRFSGVAKVLVNLVEEVDGRLQTSQFPEAFSFHSGNNIPKDISRQAAFGTHGINRPDAS